jgi:hypothetical protein
VSAARTSAGRVSAAFSAALKSPVSPETQAPFGLRFRRIDS